MGSALVQNDERPAVASARPRWNASWISVNASTWQPQTGAPKASSQPPCTAALVPTSAAAYERPAARPKPAPGARWRAPGPIASATPMSETRNHALIACHEPVALVPEPPASETD